MNMAQFPVGLPPGQRACQNIWTDDVSPILKEQGKIDAIGLSVVIWLLSHRWRWWCVSPWRREHIECARSLQRSAGITFMVLKFGRSCSRFVSISFVTAAPYPVLHYPDHENVRDTTTRQRHSAFRGSWSPPQHSHRICRQYNVMSLTRVRREVSLPF
jgi:hypothetical protein